jgi:hypothetical protein
VHPILYPAISWDGVSPTFCPGWSGTVILQICAFQIAGIIIVSHCTQPILKSKLQPETLLSVLLVWVPKVYVKVFQGKWGVKYWEFPLSLLPFLFWRTDFIGDTQWGWVKTYPVRVELLGRADSMLREGNGEWLPPACWCGGSAVSRVLTKVRAQSAVCVVGGRGCSLLLGVYSVSKIYAGRAGPQERKMKYLHGCQGWHCKGKRNLQSTKSIFD